MEYGPIDYRGWVLGDEARKGDNLRRLNILDSDEIRILKQAVPYLDARNDQDIQSL